MKTILLSLITSFIMLFSLVGVAAEKVIIKGEPIMIKQSGDYYVPSTAFTTSDYYYVTTGTDKRVCYQTVQPGLASLDAGVFTFQLGSDNVQVHCYNYSPDYFVVQ